MPILCGNFRKHGSPPTVYHNNKTEVRACCAGEAVPDCGPAGLGLPAGDATGLLGASAGLLGRRGSFYRAQVDALWQQHVLEMDMFDGEVERAREAKIKFYRRYWIRKRNVILDPLW